MPPHPSPDESQSRILRTYTTRFHLRQHWGGALILSLGLNEQGAALSVAANISGAVSLAIDNDPTRLREVVRAGAVDFTVTTLDEAVRAMKNEVRKHTPLSVALNADPIPTLAEVLERGLAPQLFATLLPPDPRIPAAAVTLPTLGGTLTHFPPARRPAPCLHSGQSSLDSPVED